jgi:hypothetical protein
MTPATLLIIMSLSNNVISWNVSMPSLAACEAEARQVNAIYRIDANARCTEPREKGEGR